MSSSKMPFMEANHVAMLVSQKTGSLTDLFTGVAGTAGSLICSSSSMFVKKKNRENGITTMSDGLPE